jgi:ribosomal protein S18 acetylase RimI-like enzyme
MRYSLRPVTDNDYGFLFELHVATMKPYVEQIWGWDDAPQAAMFRNSFVPSKRQVIVIDGQDVGVLHADRRPDEVFLANIEIAPAFQGRGLGGRIITDILVDAHANGLPVSLRLLHVNPARHLYERLGFIEFDRTETHAQMRAALAGEPG